MRKSPLSRLGSDTAIASIVSAAAAYAAWVATVDYAVWGVITAAVFWLAVIVLVASCVVPIIRRRRSRHVLPDPADSKSDWTQ